MRIQWLAGFMLLLFSGALLANAAPKNAVDGLWEAYYVDTTTRSAYVRITTEANGELKGVIEQSFPRPGGYQGPNCIKCKGADKDKPFKGLTIVWGMKPDSSNPNHWTGGHILNADNGDIYTAEATLSSDGNKLDLRGYVLSPIFGKTAIL
ncbi:MAG: DUF2147 domain-containing protein [Gammaproteobacteria bacterium]